MNVVTVIRSHGATPRIDAAGNLALDLSRVPKSLRAEVVDLARQHKTDIINELRGGPAGSPLSDPPSLAEDLLCCGYYAPDWTPEGCRRFLGELESEWPDFHVNGWHGCRFPSCWPGHLMDAVQSVYVMSLQDQGAA